MITEDSLAILAQKIIELIKEEGVEAQNVGFSVLVSKAYDKSIKDSFSNRGSGDFALSVGKDNRSISIYYSIIKQNFGISDE